LKLLTDCGIEINELAQKRVVRDKKKRARQETAGEPVEEDDGIEIFNNNVAALTKRLEEQTRRAIDGQQALHDLNIAMEHTAKESVALGANHGMAVELLQTQQAQTQTQRETQREVRRGPDDEDVDMEDAPQDGVHFSSMTTPGASATAKQVAFDGPGPSVIFQERFAAVTDTYQALSLRMRYSEHNSYKEFKQQMWFAQHPDDDSNPPNESTWFNEFRGSPAPGTAPDGEEGEESDDDLAIWREKISTKCPLTLTELRDPASSRKCPHVFEKQAIMDLIVGAAGSRGRRPPNASVVACPVSGCNQTITASDVWTNPIVVRRIKQIQSRRDKDRDMDESEDEEGNVVNSDSDNGGFDDIDDDDDDEVQAPGRRSGRSVPPKREARSSIQN
jgi:hypothetical protein